MGNWLEKGFPARVKQRECSRYLNNCIRIYSTFMTSCSFLHEVTTDRKYLTGPVAVIKWPKLLFLLVELYWVSAVGAATAEEYCYASNVISYGYFRIFVSLCDELYPALAHKIMIFCRLRTLVDCTCWVFLSSFGKVDCFCAELSTSLIDSFIFNVCSAFVSTVGSCFLLSAGTNWNYFFSNYSTP